MRTKFLAMWTAVLMAATNPVFAHAGVKTYETNVVNHVSIGDVNVSLSEYELDADGEEIPYKDGKLVLPGQKVDKIVRATNRANPAWIRMRLEYTSDDGIQDLSDDMVVLASDEWIRAGDCWYWPEPLDTDESVDFIRQVMIPPEWNETYSKKQFSIVVSVEAVQEANFTPDFETLDPWFGTVIETCTHSVYKKPEDTANQAFSIVFENGAEGLVRTGDDFFSNWSELMPGDTVSDTVQLKNSYHRPVTLYFRSETLSDNALAKALRLKITAGDKTIYEGTLDGAVLEKVELARLQSGQEATLTYALTVPAELNNAYALTDAQTKWIFSAELRTGSSGGGGGESSSGGHSSSDNSHGPGTQKETKPDSTGNPIQDAVEEVIDKTADWIWGHVPKMGDAGAEYVLAAVSVTAFAVVVLLTMGRKKKKKGEDRHEK